MNQIDPPQRKTTDILGSFITHRTQEEVKPEEEEEEVRDHETPSYHTQRGNGGGAISPISKHHCLLQTLSAGFMEPLLTPEALQHLQVPPADTTQVSLVRAITTDVSVSVCVRL